MIINRILGYILAVGLIMPAGLVADQTVPETSRVEQIKKIAKLVGYGTLTATGIGLSTACGGFALRHLVMDPTKKPTEADIQNAQGCNKSILQLKRFFSPSLPEPGESKLHHSASLLTGTAITGGIGLGMTFLGIRGLRKTLYGQTQSEKQAEKEQNEKIKETIKETGRIAFDISRRSARITLYGIATAFGVAADIFSIGTIIQGFTDQTESILSAKRYHYKKFKIAHAKENIRPVIAGTIAAPIGIAALIFGIRGLQKEYRSWKESKTRENIFATVQAVKDKIEQTMNNAANGIILGHSDEPIESKIETISTEVKNEKSN